MKLGLWEWRISFTADMDLSNRLYVAINRCIEFALLRYEWREREIERKRGREIERGREGKRGTERDRRQRERE